MKTQSTNRAIARQQAYRLAVIRSQWMLWSARADTSTWESTFFFEIIDSKNAQIRRLRRQMVRLQRAARGNT